MRLTGLWRGHKATAGKAEREPAPVVPRQAPQRAAASVDTRPEPRVEARVETRPPSRPSSGGSEETYEIPTFLRRQTP